MYNNKVNKMPYRIFINNIIIIFGLGKIVIVKNNAAVFYLNEMEHINADTKKNPHQHQHNIHTSTHHKPVRFKTR